MTAVTINTVSPETFTSSVLIGDIVQSPGGSNDVPPSMTRVNNVPVSAALEIQSTQGALLLPRMTTTQRDSSSFVPTNGMMIFNSTTGVVNIYQGGMWVEGSGNVVGPGSSTPGDIAVFADTSGELLDDSGVNITAVPPPLLSLGIGDPLVNDVQLGGIDILKFGSSGSGDVGVVYRNTDYVYGIFPNSLVGRSPNVVFGFANPSSPDAYLELTEGAILLSRLDQTAIDALIDVDGMIVYNTDTEKFNFNENGSWISFGTGSGSVTSITAGTNLTGGTITTTGTIALSANPTGLTSLGVGTLSIGGQTITGTAVNNDINIRPNGTGSVSLGSNATPVTITSTGTLIADVVTASGPGIVNGNQLNINIANINPSAGIPGNIAFYDADSSSYVGFKAPSIVSSLTVWELPSQDGSSGQALTTDGSAVLSFATLANRNSKFIVQTSDSSLPNAQALGSLSTGLLKSTTTTGVLSIATPGTDYGTVSSITAGTNLTGGTITTTGTIALSATPTGLTSLGVGTLSLSGHQIISTGTNQDINIIPNGTGSTVFGSSAVTLTNSGLIIASAVTATTINGTNVNSGPLNIASSGGAPSALTFNDANDSNFVGFRSSNVVTSNLVWVLPAADGSSGQALTTDGSTNLSFSTVANRAAKYIVQTSDSSLTNAQALGSLATGLVKNTTTTGVLSIGTAGTDYYSPNNPTILYEDDVNLNLFIGKTAGVLPVPGSANGHCIVGISSGTTLTSASTTNTLFGVSAGQFITSGSGNTYVGFTTGQSAQTGSNNSFYGNGAGSANTTYTQCTFIGATADAAVNSLTNATAIGYGASVAVSNALVLGNGAKVGIGTSSPSYTLHLSSSAQALKVGGGYIAKYTTTSSTSYTALTTDYIIKTTSTSAITITLPAGSATNQGQIYLIKDGGGNAGTNNITVAPASGNIDNAANVKITTNYGKMQVFSDGSNWFTI